MVFSLFRSFKASSKVAPRTPMRRAPSRKRAGVSLLLESLEAREVLSTLTADGPIILVNTTTAGTQQLAEWGLGRVQASQSPTNHPRSVAVDSQGNFVVAWETFDSPNWALNARVFNAD